MCTRFMIGDIVVAETNQQSLIIGAEYRIEDIEVTYVPMGSAIVYYKVRPVEASTDKAFWVVNGHIVFNKIED